MKIHALVATLFLVGCAASAPKILPTSQSNGRLTDAKGMTLYTFKKDLPGVSNCYDKCATTWPPFIAANTAKAAGDLTLVQRKDGSMQWAYKGQPLYRFIGDTEVGQAGGEGTGGTWYSVRTTAVTGSVRATPAAGSSDAY
jgi:predicted lipoprotein with Yx(FWY)xxD motif